MIDPELGSGLRDATDAIEAEITAICAARPGSSTWLEGGTLEFSSGIYKTTRTIQLPGGWGFKMQGNSCATNAPKQGVLSGGGPWLSKRFEYLATAILYEGPQGDPVFRSAAMGAEIDGISIWCPDGARAGMWVAAEDGQDKSNPGIAIGHHRFGYFTVEGAVSAVECGHGFDDGNCGDLSFQHLESHCKHAIKVNNSQGMNYWLGFCQSNGGDAAFEFPAGGKFHCSMFSSENNKCILRTGKQGTGNGAFSFGHIVADAWHDEYPVVVDVTEDQRLCVDIFSLHLPDALKHKPQPRSVFNVPGNARVNIYSAQYMPDTIWGNVNIDHVRHQI